MQVQKSRRQEAMVQEGITTLASYVANNNDFKRMTSSWEVSILQHCNFHWRRFTLGTIYIGDNLHWGRKSPQKNLTTLSEVYNFAPKSPKVLSLMKYEPKRWFTKIFGD